MLEGEKVNILLVDDQPGKLLSYEVILKDLDENLLKASSGREALEHLLKSDVAVILVDVCMPDLDGFQLAAMIREHPRFQKTAIIFISAIHLSEMDRLRGYEMGAVDYVPVPVVPELLRAKVRIFIDLYRKARQLELINTELEQRVALRTAELEASTHQLRQSEERRTLALAAGNMGSWDWNRDTGECVWDDGQYRIFGVDSKHFAVTSESVRATIHPEDWEQLQASLDRLLRDRKPTHSEFRIKRPNAEVRWCYGTAAPSLDDAGCVARISGVTVDITDRKLAEERQTLLAREVDHRAKNALALVQSILRLTRASDIATYTSAVEGRIRALSRAHTTLSLSRWHGADIRGLVDEELAPYRTAGDAPKIEVSGPNISLQPGAAQSLALALHELATNAAKYGALSCTSGRLQLSWAMRSNAIVVSWREAGGPATAKPNSPGFGMRIITAIIEGQLGGSTNFQWRTEGLECALSVPVADVADVGPTTRSYSEENGPRSALTLAGNRIMVIEDEALVAMALRESLNELGFDVIGPFSRVSDAMRSLRTNRVDAAILDVNLGGELVYPLADVLCADRIPIVFVTGYGAEEIVRRFANVPVLQKPIEIEALKSVLRLSTPSPEGHNYAKTG